MKPTEHWLRVSGPTLSWEGIDGDGSAVTYEMAFGYFNNKPTALLFTGDIGLGQSSNVELKAFIPKGILIEAFTSGWANEEK